MIEINSQEKGKEKVPAIKVTGIPGKHVSGTIEVLNYFIKAVSLSTFLLAYKKTADSYQIPPTKGWMKS